MRRTGRNLLAAACLLVAPAVTRHLICPAYGSGFTAFADDEEVCRRAGTAAIADSSGPSAAQRYDSAYRRCMAAHGRARQMNAYPQDAYHDGSLHGFEYPDAFYSIPYATPGYGYDGFSD